MHYLFVGLIAASLWSAAYAKGKPPVLDTDQEKINYSLGYQVGGDLKKQGIGLDRKALVQGIADAVSEAQPLLPPEEMKDLLAELKRKVVALEQKQALASSHKTLQADQAFISENVGKAGVVTLDSGLQYKVLKEGSGKNPAPDGTVTINYRGKLPNGNEFGSSYDKDGKSTPATYALPKLIPGLRQALPLMREGAKWQIFIPPSLSFSQGTGPFKARAVVYEVELLSAGAPAP